MKPNGPAIKGGCVTWRSIRAVSWYFSREFLPVARQVWRAFCHPGTSIIGSRRGRGTSLINGRDFLQVEEAPKWHWRSVAVQIVSEAEFSQDAELLLRAAAGIRVLGCALVLVSGSESCKKHDKQLTFIVRVICRVNSYQSTKISACYFFVSL